MEWHDPLNEMELGGRLRKRLKDYNYATQIVKDED